MKPQIRTTLFSLGLTLMVSAVLGATPPTKAQAQAKEVELQRLRNTIQNLTNNLDNLNNQHKEGRAKLRTLDQKIGKIDQALRDTADQRDRQNDKISKLQVDKRDMQNQLYSQRQGLTRQIQAAYRMGQQGSLKILLNATEPAALQRSLRYYDYFYRSRTQRISDLDDTLQNLATLEQTIQTQQQELDSLLAKQRSQRESLEASRRERKDLLADLDRDIQGTRQRLSQLKEDEQSLQDLVKRLRQALVNIPAPRGPGKAFAQSKGQLPLPVVGSIAARFGVPRQVGQLKWQGIVIDAADGADVKVVAAGRVVFADWLRGFGLLLIIDHGDSYMSLYGYNQALRVNVGDAVKAGDIVATVGDSTGHNPSGLYFEIRHQGTPVDPLLWCKAK